VGLTSLDTSKMTSKHRVEYATFQKWQCDLDHKYQTMSWLDCSCDQEGSKKPVNKLRCKVCSEFVDRIKGMKNFSDKWIVGADKRSRLTNQSLDDLLWVRALRCHSKASILMTALIFGG